MHFPFPSHRPSLNETFAASSGDDKSPLFLIGWCSGADDIGWP
jgi:hypothetical protein